MGELRAEVLVSGSYLYKDIMRLTRNGYFLKYMSESDVNEKRNMISYNELTTVCLHESFMNVIMARLLINYSK